MLSCWIGHGEQIHIREGREIIYERFIEHQLCTWLGDGKGGLVLVIRDRVQIKTKQMRSFQIVANALAEENQKDGVKSIWILDVIWQKKQMLTLLIYFFPKRCLSKETQREPLWKAILLPSLHVSVFTFLKENLGMFDFYTQRKILNIKLNSGSHQIQIVLTLQIKIP